MPDSQEIAVRCTPDEAVALQEALDDPVLKATAVCVGLLRRLPTDRARRRAIRYVSDRLEDEQGRGKQ